MLTKLYNIIKKSDCKLDFGHFTEPPSPPLLIEVPDYIHSKIQQSRLTQL
jgi:hypothetical protein